MGRRWSHAGLPLVLALTLCSAARRSHGIAAASSETLLWSHAVEHARGAAVATDAAGDVYVGGTVDGVRHFLDTRERECVCVCVVTRESRAMVEPAPVALSLGPGSG